MITFLVKKHLQMAQHIRIGKTQLILYAYLLGHIKSFIFYICLFTKDESIKFII